MAAGLLISPRNKPLDNSSQRATSRLAPEVVSVPSYCPGIIIPIEMELYKKRNEGKDPPEHHCEHLEKLYKGSLK